MFTATRSLAALLILAAFLAPLSRTAYAQDDVTFEQTQALGGPFSNAAANATHVFVNQGLQLTVLDATDLAVLDQSLNVPSGTLSGTLLLGMTNQTLTITDVADPVNPVVLAALVIDDDTFRSARPPIVVGDRAYVAMSSFNDGAIQVVDISDPANPVVTGTVELVASRMAFTNDHLFVLDRNRDEVVAFDLTDPDTPTEVGVIDLGFSNDDIAAAGTLVFVGIRSGSDAGLTIIDASDPANMAFLIEGFIGTSDSYGALLADGDVVYANNFDDPRTTDVIDVSNPAAPVFRSSIESSFDVAMAKVGDVLYEVSEEAVRALDVANPDAPAETATLESPFAFTGQLVVIDGHLYANSEQPMRMGIADDGTTTFEATLPFDDFPTAIGGTTGTLYVGGFGLLTRYDVTDPDNPVQQGSFAAAGASLSLAATGSLVFVTHSTFDPDEIEIIDFADPDTPVLRSTYLPGAHANNLVLDAAGTTLYVVTETALEVVDVTAPDTPTLLGSVALAGTGQTVAVADASTLFVGSLDIPAPFSPPEGWFVEAIDVTDPATPALIDGLSGTDGAVVDLMPVGQGIVVGSFPDFGLRAFSLDAPIAGKRGRLMESVVTRGSDANGNQFGQLSGIDLNGICNLFGSTGNGFFSPGDPFLSGTGPVSVVQVGKPPVTGDPIAILTSVLVESDGVICPPDSSIQFSIGGGSFTANEVADWQVNQVTFPFVGSGLNAEDLEPTQVELIIQGVKVPVSGINPSTGPLVELIFATDFVVAASATVPFTFMLTLDYESLELGGQAVCSKLDEVIDIRFSLHGVNDVVAEPLEQVDSQQEPIIFPTFSAQLATRLACVHNVTELPDFPEEPVGFATIQAAVDDAEQGHFLSVCPGTYRETVSIGDGQGGKLGVTLSSFEGPDTTTVRSPAPDQDVITLTDNEITLQGFFIRDGNNGVTIDGDDALVGSTTASLTAPQSARAADDLCLACNAIGGNDSNGILINANSDRATVVGNFVGVVPDGTETLGNGDAGIESKGLFTRIGVFKENLTTGFAGNVISGNADDGIVLTGNSAEVADNIIGLLPDGTTGAGNGAAGIRLTERDNGSLIGAGREGSLGTPKLSPNIISDNFEEGILVQSNATQIGGNFIGLDQSGTSIRGNFCDGILVDSTAFDVLLGGFQDFEEKLTRSGNVISGNGDTEFGGDEFTCDPALSDGIEIRGSRTRVIDSFIGLDQEGVVGLGNTGHGIHVTAAATETRIGLGSKSNGSDIAGSIIAGNVGDGIAIFGDDTHVVDSFIGLDVFGTKVVPNLGDGIHVHPEAERTLIGATVPILGDTLVIAGNVVSGNERVGLHILSSNTAVGGNTIGLDSDGQLRLGNGIEGILIGPAADSTRIGSFLHGDDLTFSGNTISGNQRTGIVIQGDHAQVTANLIGLSADGKTAVPNGDPGVDFIPDMGIDVQGGADRTLIGGARNVFGNVSVSGNTISGNDDEGIRIRGDATEVVGNIIGLSADGTEAIGHPSVGILIEEDARDTLIGAATSNNFVEAAGNTISGNGTSGVEVRGPSTVLVDNIIGLDPEGRLPFGNGGSGIKLSADAISTTIGAFITLAGELVADGNTISANEGPGISVAGTDTDILANIIGLTADGADPAGNGSHGIHLTEDTKGGMLIGASIVGALSSLVAGNTISDNQGHGIFDETSQSDVDIVDNTIGLDDEGTLARPNTQSGIRVSGSLDDLYRIGATIDLDGNLVVAGNTISGNDAHGIDISGSDPVEVGGNIIGLNGAGTEAIGNVENGIEVALGGAGTLLGGFRNGDGTITLAGNTISGNQKNGIEIGSGSEQVQVVGNTIGLDVAGQTAIGNQQSGIQVRNDTSTGTLIGAALDDDGAFVFSGNTIAGNTQNGIALEESIDTQIVGNVIGMDAAAQLGLDVGNEQHGIQVHPETQGTLIGAVQADDGTFTVLGNTISRNRGSGLELGGEGTQVVGNKIGTDLTGTEDRGNLGTGITTLTTASGTRIGVLEAEEMPSLVEGNVIAGNADNGLTLQGSDTKVFGNLIGLEVEGTFSILNEGDGIFIDRLATSIQIGAGEAERNTISGNGDSGIHIQGTGVQVSDNRIGVSPDGQETVRNFAHGIRVEGTDNASQAASANLDRNLIAGSDVDDFAGIFLRNARSTTATGNEVRTYAFGLQATDATSLSVTGNIFDANGTAIDVGAGTSGVTLSGNTIIRSSKPRTGIHFSGGAGGLVRGNAIEDNNGAGLFVEGDGLVTVEANNFSGNPEFALLNEGANPIDAAGNFWGAADGPSGEGDGSGDAVSTGVDFSGFLGVPIAVVIGAPLTVTAEADVPDSTTITFQNYDDPDDVLTVDITDELGWITDAAGTAGNAAEIATTVALADAVGGSTRLVFNVPAGTPDGTENVVTIIATSQSNASQADTVAMALVAGDLADAVLPVELTDLDVLVDTNPDANPDAEGTPDADAPAEQRIAGRFDYNAVVLRWQTASETNNAGFFVELRSPALPEGWQPHGFVEGAGTTTETQQYRYRIAGLEPGRYRFRLRQVDYDGTFAYSPEIEVTVEAPRKLKLSPNYPNPFNPSTEITFTVPRDGPAEVVVYDVLGRRVAVLYDDEARAGTLHRVRFDASSLASGLYLYQIHHAGQVRTRTMTLVK